MTYFSGGLSSAEVIALIGSADLVKYASPQRPQGTTLNGDAPFFTLGAQGAVRNTGISWYAGISSAALTLASTSVFTDSLLSSQVFVNQKGDSLISGTVQRWHFYTGLQGRQINIPIGIRYTPPVKGWHWLQIGINLAPGFTVNHKNYRHLSLQHGTVVTTPAGTEVQHVWYNTDSDTRDIHVQRVPANFFTAYASVPIHATTNPSTQWQFTLGLEPGVTLLRPGNASNQTVFMTRLSLGCRYRFNTAQSG